MDLAGAGRAVEPSIEAGTHNIQHVTQLADRPDVAVFGDEGEPHFASRAKKAAAFFKMSRSARRRATFFFSTAISAKSARICPFPGERCGRGRDQFPHPAAQHALRQIEVTRGLRYRHTPVRHQPYDLYVKLTAELPSRHIQSPASWSRSYLRVNETGTRPQQRFSVDGNLGAFASERIVPERIRRVTARPTGGLPHRAPVKPLPAHHS